MMIVPVCRVCCGIQRWTPSGMTCPEGHGGAKAWNLIVKLNSLFDGSNNLVLLFDTQVPVEVVQETRKMLRDIIPPEMSYVVINRETRMFDAPKINSNV